MGKITNDQNKMLILVIMHKNKTPLAIGGIVRKLRGLGLVTTYERVEQHISDMVVSGTVKQAPVRIVPGADDRVPEYIIV